MKVSVGSVDLSEKRLRVSVVVASEPKKVLSFEFEPGASKNDVVTEVKRVVGLYRELMGLDIEIPE